MHKASAKLVVAIGGAAGLVSWAQTPAPPVDKATAYYHYSLGHMYAELAGIYGNRGEYINQAIENYKLAIKADPLTAKLAEELSDLYIQSGRFRDAQNDAEATLRTNPKDIAARRVLARIYLRQIGDAQRNRIDQTMLRRALEQFQTITEIDPKDIDAWLMLGRLHKVGQNSPESEKAYKKALEVDPENEDALNGLALVYADLGDNKAAADLLKRAAARRPSPNSLQTLAGAYEQMREYGLAAEALRRALDLNPPNADELKKSLAQDLALAERYPDALQVYEEIVADDSADSQSWLRISQIQLRLRDPKKAREASDRAKAIEPNNVDVRYNDVSILQAEGKDADAIVALKDLLVSTEKRSYNPGERRYRVALLEQLGSLERETGQTEPAVESFRKMAQLDAETGPRASVQIIETYRQSKQFPKAQQEADASEKKWPNDPQLRMTRASLLAEMGKADAAASDIRKLLGGSQDRETWLALAQLYDKGRKWDDMAKALDQAEKLSEREADKEGVWFMRGAMFERMKNLDAAEREFRKVLASAPDNTGAMNYMSYMFADRNVKLSEALTLINRALEAEPFNGAYLDTLGWVYYRMGRLPEAEDYLVRALERVPRDPTMRDHLAEVLFQRSKFREAVVQWEASLREWQASSPADLDQAEVAKVRNKLDTARSRVANAR